MHSGMLDRMLSMVIPYVDMMPMCWCGMIPVWGMSPVVISSKDCKIGKLLVFITSLLT